MRAQKYGSTGVASRVENILEGRDVRGHQGLRRDQLNFSNSCDNLVRKEGFLIKAKHQAANKKLNSVLRQRSNFEGRQRIWVCDDKSAISAAGHARSGSSCGWNDPQVVPMGVEANTLLDRPVLYVDRGPWQGARR